MPVPTIRQDRAGTLSESDSEVPGTWASFPSLPVENECTLTSMEVLGTWLAL